MIIRDSTLHDIPAISKPNKLDGDVRVGIVREAKYDADQDAIYYLVEVTHKGLSYILNCRQMTKFGDVYNYEEWGARNVNIPVQGLPKPRSYANRVGEVVVVAHLGGSSNDGVIIGSMKHPARKSKITSNSMQYVSEFNGLNTSIDETGAYKITFKGTSLSVSALKGAVATGQIPAPTYDPVSSGSYLTFEKDGSFEVSDAHPLVQTIRMDKANGTIQIASGPVELLISKKGGAFSLKAVDSKIESSKTLTVSTLSTSIESLKEIKIKSAKIAIGFGGVELIDSLIKIVDAIGTLVVSSPVGPCSPVKSAPTWTQLEQIKVKLSTIKGSL
jgi:hypothetical protein